MSEESHTHAPDELVARLARYDRLVEVGVGNRPEVASALAARGRSVVATDVHAVSVPDGVRFVRDDVVAASERVDPGEAYHADALYARNLPEELQRPAATVARTVGADLLFTTLGFESPVVDADRESLADGETLYVVRLRG